MDAYISNDGYNSSEKSGSRGKCGILYNNEASEKRQAEKC